MFYMVYVSSVSAPFSAQERAKLIEQARPQNASRGITSLLLQCETTLIQVLEGPEQEVRATYARIAASAKHRDLRVLLQGHRESRQFPGWPMEFRDLSFEELETYRQQLDRWYRHGNWTAAALPDDLPNSKAVEQLLRVFAAAALRRAAQEARAEALESA
jgi:Sensors of blue-light using FAD